SLERVQMVVDLLPSQADPRGQRRRRGGRDELGEEATPHGLQGHRRRRRIIDDLDVEHGEMVSLTTFFVKEGSRLFSAKFAKSMACRRIVKLRRGLLLWPLVGPTRATARRVSVSSTEVSENRILGSNAYSHCQPVAVENREAIRTTSKMDD